MMEWTDDGTNLGESFDFQDDSSAECMKCGAYGTVEDLLAEVEPYPTDESTKEATP